APAATRSPTARPWPGRPHPGRSGRRRSPALPALRTDRPRSPAASAILASRAGQHRTHRGPAGALSGPPDARSEPQRAAHTGLARSGNLARPVPSTPARSAPIDLVIHLGCAVGVFFWSEHAPKLFHLPTVWAIVAWLLVSFIHRAVIQWARQPAPGG